MSEANSRQTFCGVSPFFASQQKQPPYYCTQQIALGEGKSFERQADLLHGETDVWYTDKSIALPSSKNTVKSPQPDELRYRTVGLWASFSEEIQA